ncbi:glycerate kinase [Jeotgalibacillus sp. JSM ZJ347]|uniref:glycerate kinase n=1 Tax=Jeotgalibacillus sp. JSM ZJ347 TaxID=3342117 RepID=UPI0035A828A1
MKVVIAPDSFKGSISAERAAAVISRSVKAIHPNAKVVLKPMADGGEGTLDALLAATDGEKVPFICRGPLGETRESFYLKLRDGTAVIEGAEISGLPLVPEAMRNPDNTTSYGIGEAISHAVGNGATSILIGLGGSSSNDGGLGMLQALGVKAFDEAGIELPAAGSSLLHVSSLDFSKINPGLKGVKIRVACDVDNPLTGQRGATAVYGPQKGATPEQILRYDEAMNRYGNLVEASTGSKLMVTPGAGAAGGLGFALLSIGASLVSGAELIADAIGLENVIAGADLVITGEGQSDEQTLYGKAPGQVANIASTHRVPVVLISGSLAGDLTKLNEQFTACFSIIPGVMPLEECMRRAEELLYDTASQVMRLV